MKDHEAVQRFFLQEIQLGEELLAAGDLENGVDHLGNAVAVCGQPNDLLQVDLILNYSKYKFNRKLFG